MAINNLKYLQAIKKDSFKKDMIDYPEKIGFCLEDRKVVALEIIAEQLYLLYKGTNNKSKGESK